MTRLPLYPVFFIDWPVLYEVVVVMLESSYKSLSFHPIGKGIKLNPFTASFLSKTYDKINRSVSVIANNDL